MGLELPSLDDRSYDDLLEDALARLPTRTDEWTDHNPSDPGIAILETLAWAAESSIYQLDRVTGRHRRQYLELLGVRPRPPQPASLRLAVERPSDGPDVVEAGEPLAARTGAGDVASFAAADDLVRSPASVVRVVARHRDGRSDHTTANDADGLDYPAFGPAAREGSALYLGFDADPFAGGRALHLDVDYHDRDLEPPATHGSATPTVRPPDPVSVRDGPESGASAADDVLSEPDAFEPSVAVDWQYPTDLEDWWDHDAWASLGVPTDETRQLYRGGRVALAPPGDPDRDDGTARLLGAERPRHWLRCVVVEDGHEVAPRLDAIRTNVLRATHRQERGPETLTRTDGRAETTAHPDQTFEFEHAPVLAATVTVGGEEWRRVPTLAGSGPGDRHYVLDAAAGTVRFGNGTTGAVPEAGRAVVATSYVTGGGSAGNVPADADWAFPDRQASVAPLEAASGGSDAETADEALARLRRDRKRAHRAVTREDVREVAASTPGLRVARTDVRREPDESAGRDGVGSTGTPADHAAGGDGSGAARRAGDACAPHGTLRVVVVPESRRDRPVPSEGFREAVARHLERHRLLGDRVAVDRPEYVGIGVDATVEAADGAGGRDLPGAVEAALREFLHPLDGYDGAGWPFGRPVHESELHETVADVPGVGCVRRLDVRATGRFDRTASGVAIPPGALVYSTGHDVTVRPRGGRRCEGGAR